MVKLGIIGYPLGHSISAVIQKAGLASIGLDGSYDVMETPPEDLINRIKYIKSNGYDGFNVTIPLKVPMSLFLDDIDDYANIAGCVNTVKVGDETKSESVDMTCTELDKQGKQVADLLNVVEYKNNPKDNSIFFQTF